ncbi:MAG: ABC transporter substrate-binding protein, partial [Halomonas sp.]|nr:ABC transporter substrate-binding protein [Halomonas sp.]
MKDDSKQAGKPALKLMVCAVAGASAMGLASVAQAQQTLNIVSWGGAYTESQQKAYHEPWMEQTGDEIINLDRSGNALAGLRAQTQAGNVTW